MSFVMKSWAFNKKVNSTSLPSGTATEHSIDLKDNTSIITPTIKLKTWNTSHNYVYIAKFNRYYFVTDTRYNRGEWEVDLKVDVLGSYKTGIGSMSAYVLRSASDSDGRIIDNYYPTKSNEIAKKVFGYFGKYSDNETDILDPFRLHGTAYCFVLGVAAKTNNISAQFGSTVYYLLTPTQMMGLMDYLMSDVSEWSDIDVSLYDEGVQRALLNPIQYIQSCVMFPFGAVKMSGNVTATHTIHFGAYSYTDDNEYVASVIYASGYSDNGPVAYTGGTVDIDKHPQALTRGEYLNGSPFTEYYVHIGPAGDFQLNPNSFIDTDIDVLTVNMVWDLTSGLCRIKIEHSITLENDNNDPLLDTTVQGGVSINLTQAYTDPLKNGLTLASAAGNLISMGISRNIGGIISTTASGVGDLLEGKFPKASGIGTSGAMLNLFNGNFQGSSGFYITEKFNLIVDENNTDLGRPLCKTKTLNTLSGFILCSSADYGGAGTAEERDEINNYLNTGFFYL